VTALTLAPVDLPDVDQRITPPCSTTSCGTPATWRSTVHHHNGSACTTAYACQSCKAAMDHLVGDTGRTVRCGRHGYRHCAITWRGL
jgi:hypothetical protein